MKTPKIVFDGAMLLVYIIAANPVLTGIPVHEFVGLGAFLVITAHVALSADGLTGRGHILRLVLNILLIASLAACVVSGVMVSGTVLPALGLYATGYFFWDPFHALAAKVLLAVLLVHIVLRGPAFIAWVRRKVAPKNSGADASVASASQDDGNVDAVEA